MDRVLTKGKGVKDTRYFADVIDGGPLGFVPVSVVDAFEEALRHLARLDDHRAQLARRRQDVGLGRANHARQALLVNGTLLNVKYFDSYFHRKCEAIPLHVS